MDEKSEKTEEEKKPEATAVAEDNGDKQQTAGLIEQGNVTAERMEKATEDLRKENDRKEAMIVKQQLAGRAEAGDKPKEETEDEKWAKGAKERYEGTGMSPVEDEDGK